MQSLKDAKRSSRIGTLLSSLLALAALTVAVPTTAFAEDATKTLKVDKAHSDFLVRAKHLGVGYTFLEFNDMSGEIKFNDEDPSKSSINLTVKAASVESHNKKRDGHLKSPDFLSAKKYPEITFESDSIEKVDDGTFEVSGDLTIRDVTKPVTVEVKYLGKAKGPKGKTEHRGFYTEFSIDRTDFGVNWKPDAGIVGKELHLIIALEAVRKL